MCGEYHIPIYCGLQKSSYLQPANDDSTTYERMSLEFAHLRMIAFVHRVYDTTLG